MIKDSINIWGIQEFDGDGISCLIVPVNLPWHKKLVLTFFRFGVCPLCIASSIAYSTGKFFKQRVGKFSNKDLKIKLPNTVDHL